MSAIHSEMATPPVKRRKANFKDEEIFILMREATKRIAVIHSRGEGPTTLNKQAKRAAWEAIANAVNAVSPIPRTADDMRKKFIDFKALVKKKVTSNKKELEKTDGKRSIVTLTKTEEAMATLLETDVDSIPGMVDIEGALAEDIGFQEVVEVETVEIVSSLTDHDYIGEAGNTTNPSPSSEQATKPPISHAAVHEPCQCHARQLNRPSVVQEAVGPDMLPTQQSILSDVHMNTMSKKRRIDSDDSSAASTSKQDHTPKSVPLVHKRPEATSTPISTCCLSHDGQPVLTPSWSRSKSKQTPGSQHSKHQTLILKGLLEDATFADVTLTAEGKSLKAHKAVLSAMSPYFKRVLQNNPSPHPIIIMPLDMQFEDLKGIIDYIYMGEIVVPTENLSSLFKAGRVLQISGLTSVDTVGVRAPNTPLFDNVQSMHKDTSGATLSMETNQASETRLDTSRNEDANKLQSSNGSRKSRGSSAALENVSQSEKHTHKCKGANSAIVTVEAAEPSDKSNQKRPETVDLSETESFEKTPTQQQQAKGNCTVISDDDSSRCMFMTDEESQSSDFDYKYFEEQEEELDPLQIHCHTNDDPFHQSSSISNGQQCDSFNFVTVKEELED